MLPINLFSGFCHWFPLPCPRTVAKVLFPWSPMPSPPFGDWALPFSSLNFMDESPTPPHPFLIFILFFFFVSVPLLYSSALLLSLCCVLISPTPLLCHQLAPLVSRSCSHCACVAFSFFDHTHLQFACTVVAFHKHIHRTSIGRAYLHCYYQPLTSPGRSSGFITSLCFLEYESRYGWYTFVEHFDSGGHQVALLISWYHSFWYPGSWMNVLSDWHSQEIASKPMTKT